MILSRNFAVPAALALAFGLSGPALAQTANNNSAATSAQRIVDSSTATLQKLRARPGFDRLLRKAKGVFLVPDMVKGAAIVGGAGGSGVLLVRNNGRWSNPAFFTIGSISLGAQAGGKAGPVAMFLMTDKAVADFTQHDNFSFNGNASLTVVKYSAKAQGSVGKGDIIIWSGASGLFAGVDISGSDIVADSKDDHAYYNDQQASTKQIISGRVTTSQASKLRDQLPG